MKSHSIAFVVLIAFVACCLAGAASPKTTCAECGAEAPCKKMCRLVCEEKKVEVVCWGCKCEDFCVPGPGCPTCQHCNCVCQSCGEGAASSKVCSEPKRFFWYDWRPASRKCTRRPSLCGARKSLKCPLTSGWPKTCAAIARRVALAATDARRCHAHGSAWACRHSEEAWPLKAVAMAPKGSFEAQSSLEIVGYADAPAVNPAVAQIARKCRVSMGREVVELEFQVRVEKPV